MSYYFSSHYLNFLLNRLLRKEPNVAKLDTWPPDDGLKRVVFTLSEQLFEPLGPMSSISILW